MQNENFQQMLDMLRTAKLTPLERSKIRSELIAYMRLHPARAPLYLRALDRATALAATFAFRPRLQVALASLVLVFVIGAGTSYAAENALPGNPLYAVKIHVNEPIQGAFAVSPEAKAQWSAQLAARRLSEAEALAAENKLDASTSADLAIGLDRATEDFSTNVTALASSTNNVGLVADLQSNMEATLAVHAQVLSQIADAMPETHVDVSPLLVNVEDHVRAINGTQASIDASVIENAHAAQHAALEQRDAALGQLGEAQALSQGTLAGPHAQIDSDTVAAQTAIQVGEQHMANGDYGAAMATFQAANLAAHEAKIRAYVANQIESLPGVVLPTTTVPLETTTGTSSPSPAGVDIQSQDTENASLHAGDSERSDTNEHGDLNVRLGH